MLRKAVRVAAIVVGAVGMLYFVLNSFMPEWMIGGLYWRK